MKTESQSKDILRGAFILTIGAILIKILSAVYRIPFQNIVGDMGFYIYQQVYPFYGVILVLSTYGFPVVISKLYAESLVKQDLAGIRKLFLVSTFLLILLGLSAFFLLFSGSNWLANKMGDPELSILFRVISFGFLVIPAVSLLRGYFQGQGDMVPTAISQVGEQLARVVTILLAAFILTIQGYSLYAVGAGAMFGSITGALLATFILFWFLRKKNKSFSGKQNSMLFDFKGSGKIVKAILVQGFAISVSSMLLIFLQLADSLNLYSLLISTGINGLEAKFIKGIYDRGLPLIQMGTVIATSLSLSLVPLITSEKLKSKGGSLIEKVRFSLLIGIIVGVGASGGLWSIMRPTNIMLFKNAAGTETLSVLSILILSSSFILTCTAVLQGLGYTLYPAFIILLGFTIKYALNISFVSNLGIIGAAYSSNITLCIIVVLLLSKLQFVLGSLLFNRRHLLIIILATILMITVLKTYLYITNFMYDMVHLERIVASFQSISGVLLGGLTYVIVILRGKIFKEEELALLPFGSKMLYLFPKK